MIKWQRKDMFLPCTPWSERVDRGQVGRVDDFKTLSLNCVNYLASLQNLVDSSSCRFVSEIMHDRTPDFFHQEYRDISR
jgi:hypothetical protein